MDAVDVFRATADLRLDAFAREARLQLGAKLLDVALAIDTFLGECCSGVLFRSMCR